MNRGQFILMVVLMVAASFLGGIVVSRISAPQYKIPETEPSASIEAKELIIVDENGIRRMEISVIEDGYPCLSMWDRRGIPRLMSTTFEMMTMDSGGVPHLTLYQKGEEGFLFLGHENTYANISLSIIKRRRT